MTKQSVSFQLLFKDGVDKGKTVEVMNVDVDQWEALQQIIRQEYAPKGILAYMNSELPISLTREDFLKTEKEMRMIDDTELSNEAYIALFSLDIFIRQLEDLQDSDIKFSLIP
ncbi:MAG: hypothetical protein AAF694_01210 [Bacteroidota bacterium]